MKRFPAGGCAWNICTSRVTKAFSATSRTGTRLLSSGAPDLATITWKMEPLVLAVSRTTAGANEGGCPGP